jgi:hypothetical protein
MYKLIAANPLSRYNVQNSIDTVKLFGTKWPQKNPPRTTLPGLSLTQETFPPPGQETSFGGRFLSIADLIFMHVMAWFMYHRGAAPSGSSWLSIAAKSLTLISLLKLSHAMNLHH